jgi:hypothetical protein
MLTDVMCFGRKGSRTLLAPMGGSCLVAMLILPAFAVARSPLMTGSAVAE